MRTLSMLIAFSVFTFSLAAQDMRDCPMHEQHMKAAQSKEHHEGVDNRGASHEGMGFSQTATTHHFLLTDRGGIIQVTTNDPNDKDSIAQVQKHFEQIRTSFAEGDFSIPHFVHDKTPPGVPVMREQKDNISYTVEKLANGARLNIAATSPAAVTAIHDFLRFQIADHGTGDPGTIENR